MSGFDFPGHCRGFLPPEDHHYPAPDLGVPGTLCKGRLESKPPPPAG